MKGSRFAIALASLAAYLVDAHYTFPDFIVNGTVSPDWQYVRMTDNHYDNGPITDVSLSTFKCYESNTAAQTSTATVVAGSTVGFQADNTMGHPGYFDAYMSAANPASAESAGSGNTWFKIWDWAPTYSPSTGLVFDSEGITQVTFKIPKETPSGQYLLRVEQIALHLSGTYQGAQFYLACAQINVVGGGSGSPGPLTSFPGAYTGYEPGILINIYNLPAGYTGYTAPGPAKWPAGSTNYGQGGTGVPTSGSPAPTSTSTTKAGTSSSAKTTSTTTAKATTTTAKSSSTSSKTSSTSSSGTVAHYGQCGGQGYTGPTACAAPYTCTYSNDYYSQCL